MSKKHLLIAASMCVVMCAGACASERIQLPEPDTSGGISVARAIYERKSSRRYSPRSLTMEQAAQLLWAAGGSTVDGMTGPTRAYPSAGGVYPLEIYLVAGNVEGLEGGVYKYEWSDHSLSMVRSGDVRKDLARSARGQSMIADAPATIVITAAYEKTTRRYGERGRSLYVPMDAGHLGQNVHLQAQSMGLGTVMVGAFEAEETSNVLEGAQGTPVYMMPVGYTF